MKNIKKFLAVFLAVISLTGMVYGAGTLIERLDQTVSQGDIITSTWYNIVNNFLKGPHTEGGICSYSAGKILCNGTGGGSGGGGSDCFGKTVGTSCGGGKYAGGGIVVYNSDEGAMNWESGFSTCLGKNYGGFNDWRLPTKDELRIIYTNRSAIGGFTNYYYWSSLEYNSTTAWSQKFDDGSLNSYDSKSNTYSIRCIRKF